MSIINPIYEHKKRLGLLSKKTLKSEQYSRYRNTKRWQKTRQRIIALQKVCQDCRIDKNFRVHHLTYARLGFEIDPDLILLCDDCHKIRHEIVATGV